MAVGKTTRVSLVMALLMFQGMLNVAQACGRGGLNQARGCGASDVQVPKVARDVGVGDLCFIGKSILAATLTDVRRLPHSYVMLLEMPGVSSGNVKVEVVSGNILSITGMVEEAALQGAWIRRERNSLTKLFARKFVLPQSVDTQKMSHQLDAGLLRITLPLLSGLDRLEDNSVVGDGEDEDTAFCHCTIQDVDKYIHPQPLLHSNKATCVNGIDPHRVITISALTDMWNLVGAYELIMEMPGAQDAELDVVCEDETGACTVSAAGFAQDEDEEQGAVLRMERGGAGRKVFARSFYFKPPYLVHSTNVTYHLTDGLLRVTLPKPPLKPVTPSFWDTLWKLL